MRRRPNFGSSLGSTLLVVALLSVLGAGLANLCMGHLHLVNRANSQLHASNLARSAVAAGIARFVENEAFGEAEDGSDDLHIETESGEAFLTFQTEHPDGLPFSTNNATGTTSVAGSLERTVPSTSLHLVGVGRSGGVEKRVEVVLTVPSFPWAVAAQGPIIIQDGAMVGALPAGVWPPTDSQLEPADLVSNSTSSDAVMLGSGSRVLGDVETPGGVILADDTVQVDGQIREGSEASDLPSLEADAFDPAGSEAAFDDLSAGAAVHADLELNGAARMEGDLVVNNRLDLTGANLFVNGNLTVGGSVHGTGILVVKGDVTIDSGVVLDGATTIAILATGKVTLRGQGPTQSMVRGVFFAGEGLEAERITLVGTLVAPGPDAGVRLSNTRVFRQDLTQQVRTSLVTSLPSNWSYVVGGVTGEFEVLGEDFLTSQEDGGPVEAEVTTTSPPPVVEQQTTSEGSQFLPTMERLKVVSWFES